MSEERRKGLRCVRVAEGGAKGGGWGVVNP